MGPADHTEFLGPQIYTLTTYLIQYSFTCRLPPRLPKPKLFLVAQLSQRNRAAGWVSFAKSGRLELRTIFCGWHYWSLFNHRDVIGQQLSKAIECGKKRKIKAITSFKVIEVGINWKPVCDFLLAINTNWHPISHRFGVIAAYCSHFGHFSFLRYPLWA